MKPIRSPMKPITELTFSPMPSNIVLKTGASATTATPIADTRPAITGDACEIRPLILETTLEITGSITGSIVETVFTILPIAGALATAA